MSDINISQDCGSLCKESNWKGWQWNICDICIRPLEEQFEQYELLAEATFINTGWMRTQEKLSDFFYRNTLLDFCLIQGCSWMLVSWSPFSYFSVLKKLPLITVFSETVPADESCRMFSQQNKSNNNPNLFYLKRKFVSILPVGLRNVS